MYTSSSSLSKSVLDINDIKPDTEALGLIETTCLKAGYVCQRVRILHSQLPGFVAVSGKEWSTLGFSAKGLRIINGDKIMVVKGVLVQ